MWRLRKNLPCIAVAELYAALWTVKSHARLDEDSEPEATKAGYRRLARHVPVLDNPLQARLGNQARNARSAIGRQTPTRFGI